MFDEPVKSLYGRQVCHSSFRENDNYLQMYHVCVLHLKHYSRNFNLKNEVMLGIFEKFDSDAFGNSSNKLFRRHLEGVSGGISGLFIRMKMQCCKNQ